MQDGNDTPVDVVMPTLNSERFLKRCLDSIYQFVPVRRLIVCDAGSVDRTIKILNEYPRTEVHIRPDIKTTGKAWEFLVSKVETEWFAIIYSDVELCSDWYKKMSRHKTEYDFFECRRIYHYEYEIEPAVVGERPLGGAQLARKEALRGLSCDDDYLHRMDDIYARQYAEQRGYKYGKVDDAFLTHYYAQEPARSNQPFFTFSFEPPKISFQSEEWRKVLLQSAKCAVKYLNPEASYIKSDIDFDYYLLSLDRQWIKENGPTWLSRYDRALKTLEKKRRNRTVLFPIARLLGSFEKTLRLIRRKIEITYETPEWFVYEDTANPTAT